MTELAFGDDAPLLNVMSTMRAMRRLKPDPVPRELIEQLITAATYAPSGGNNQSFTFLVVTDREQIARLAPVWRRIVDWYIGTQSPPPHMTPEQWNGIMKALRYQADHFDEVPVLIVACYELRGMLGRMVKALNRQASAFAKLGAADSLRSLRNVRRSLAIGEAASIYPSVQNLLLMARALGLAATMTTWHTMFEQEFKSILAVPGHVNIYAIVPVGWPAGKFGPVSRRPAAEAIRWERW
ncbi:MAG: nitroreductase family protein [Nocardiaceae bacterium]|nr:nitroreductase family protein [Nocardiaceae bacterium]